MTMGVTTEDDMGCFFFQKKVMYGKDDFMQGASRPEAKRPASVR